MARQAHVDCQGTSDKDTSRLLFGRSDSEEGSDFVHQDCKDIVVDCTEGFDRFDCQVLKDSGFLQKCCTEGLLSFEGTDTGDSYPDWMDMWDLVEFHGQCVTHFEGVDIGGCYPDYMDMWDIGLFVIHFAGLDIEGYLYSDYKGKMGLADRCPDLMGVTHFGCMDKGNQSQQGYYYKDSAQGRQQDFDRKVFGQGVAFQHTEMYYTRLVLSILHLVHSF